MLIWPALLLAPLLVLSELSIAYALVTAACETQRQAHLHAVPLAFLLLSLLCTALAWYELRRADERTSGIALADGDGAEMRQYFLAVIATWSGLLSSLVIVALWIPQWVLSPCAS